MYSKITYYFVDTSVILALNSKSDKHQIKFIQNPSNHFLYTETTKKLLRYHTIPNRFRYVHGNLTRERKDEALDLLGTIWNQRFNNMLSDVYLTSPKQLARFRMDFYTVFEGSSCCHKLGILPSDYIMTPPLLTCNLRFLNKFIMRSDTSEVLEETINKKGFRAP